jgi:hypothetical protein
VGIPVFETPSKQLRGITVGKVPCTYTKEMGLGCYGTFLLVPHFPSHLLATSSHSYVARCACKNPLSRTPLEICMLGFMTKCVPCASQWVKSLLASGGHYCQNTGCPHSAITLSKPFISRTWPLKGLLYSALQCHT